MDVTNPGLVNVADQTYGTPNLSVNSQAIPQNNGVPTPINDQTEPPAPFDANSILNATPSQSNIAEQTGIPLPLALPLRPGDVAVQATDVFVQDTPAPAEGVDEFVVTEVGSIQINSSRQTIESLVISFVRDADTYAPPNPPNPPLPAPQLVQATRYLLYVNTSIIDLASFGISLIGREILFTDGPNEGASRIITNYSGNFIAIDRTDESDLTMPILVDPVIGQGFDLDVNRQNSEVFSDTFATPVDVTILPSSISLLPLAGFNVEEFVSQPDVNVSLVPPAEPVITSGEDGPPIQGTYQIADQESVYGIPLNFFIPPPPGGNPEWPPVPPPPVPPTPPPVVNSFSFRIHASSPFTLPILGGGVTHTQNFYVNWGDGSPVDHITIFNSPLATHNYVTGDYTITMTGTCQWFAFNQAGDCTSVTSLLSFTGDMGFKVLNFCGCTNLTTIIPLGTMNSLADAGAIFAFTGISTIPSNTFAGCPNITTFNSAFRTCPNLTAIPAGLFDACTNVTTGDASFLSCHGLVTIPSELFRLTTNWTGFNNVFGDCPKAVLRADIFYRAGEQGTRFAGKGVDFANAFKRSSYSGVQGTAPDLWNCTFGSVASTDCFDGAGNDGSSLSNYASIPVAWGGPFVASSFSFRVATAGGNFTLPIAAGGAGFDQIFDVDWGDGTPHTTVTLFSDNVTHAYAAGTWDITMTGICEWFAFNNSGSSCSKVTELLSFSGDMGFKVLNFYGCWQLTTSLGTPLLGTMNSLTTIENMFRSCTGVTVLPSDFFGSLPYVTSAAGVFKDSGITKAPGTLFDGCPGIITLKDAFANCSNLTDVYSCLGLKPLLTDVSDMFVSCSHLNSIAAGLFSGCPAIIDATGVFAFTGISSIPSSLFSGCPNITTFNSAFRTCPNLTAIPAHLFDANTQVTDFTAVFAWCDHLTTIASGDLFKFNTLVTSFDRAFGSDVLLSSIPAGLFTYNTLVQNFNWVFGECHALTAIPAGLFDTCVNVHTGDAAFLSCHGLVTIPSELFRLTTNWVHFNNVFGDCPKAVLIADIFYATGEQGIRFAGKGVNFANAFKRSSYSGVQGTAPDLWNCTFGSVASTDCFDGAGNDGSSLSNYASIPVAWGGPFV